MRSKAPIWQSSSFADDYTIVARPDCVKGGGPSIVSRQSNTSVAEAGHGANVRNHNVQRPLAFEGRVVGRTGATTACEELKRDGYSPVTITVNYRALRRTSEIENPGRHAPQILHASLIWSAPLSSALPIKTAAIGETVTDLMAFVGPLMTKEMAIVPKY